MDLFHAEHGAREQWPDMCYWFSQKHNPIREELSIFGQDQTSERHADLEAQSEGQGSPHRSTPIVRESGNGRTSRTQENQKAPSHVYHSPPQEHCVTCGENIQVYK